MIDYYRPIVSTSRVVSIDMVTYDIKVTNVRKLQHLLNCGIADYYYSAKNCTYKHFFNIDGGIKLMFDFNGFTKNMEKFGILQFNPNKVMNSVGFDYLVKVLYKYVDVLSIKRVDLAIDFQLPRVCFDVVKSNQRYAEYRLSTSNRTQYIGTHQHNGFIKIYNKSIESCLNSDLTRVELTITDFSLDNINNYLSKVKLLSSDFTNKYITDFNDTEKVLYELLLSTENIDYYMSRLGRKIRDKFKNIVYSESCVLTDFEYLQFQNLLNDLKNFNFVK